MVVMVLHVVNIVFVKHQRPAASFWLTLVPLLPPLFWFLVGCFTDGWFGTVRRGSGRQPRVAVVTVVVGGVGIDVVTVDTLSLQVLGLSLL